MTLIFFAFLASTGLVSALACKTSDLHLLNGFGATVAAVCALLVILQVRAEEHWDEEEGRDEADVGRVSPFFKSLAARIFRTRQDDRRQARLALIRKVAIMLFFAELLHGWGDRVLMRMCPVSEAAIDHHEPAPTSNSVTAK